MADQGEIAVAKKLGKAGLLLLGLMVLANTVLFAIAWQHKNDFLRIATAPPGCQQTWANVGNHVGLDSSENCAIRLWYNEQVAVIPGLMTSLSERGVALKGRAHCAYGVRHQARMAARAVMPSQFDVALLRLRDFYTYGDFDGPDFSELVDEKSDSATYKAIIASAQRTNKAVNEQCGIEQAKK